MKRWRLVAFLALFVRSDLLVHYLFDSNYDTIVEDRSGNLNVGQKFDISTSGVVNTPYGLYLNNQYLKLPNNLYDNTFPYTTSFTMTLFFRLLSNSNPTQTIFHFNTGFGHGVHLYRSYTGSPITPLKLMITAGSDITYTTPTTYNESEF